MGPVTSQKICQNSLVDIQKSEREAMGTIIHLQLTQNRRTFPLTTAYDEKGKEFNVTKLYRSNVGNIRNVD